MADYLHYWTPLRAQRAFRATDAPIRALDHGQFTGLKRDDVVWICTKSHERLQLVLRGEVSRPAELVAKPPRYAVGNSRGFEHRRVVFKTTTKRLPYLIPIDYGILKRLRFFGRSSRVEGSLNDILVGPLASRRRMKEEVVHLLTALWDKRKVHPWDDLMGSELSVGAAVDISDPDPSRRVESTASRIVRDTAEVRRLKRLHRHRCQICGKALAVANGDSYSEGHHLRPLGRDHNGPDIADNILVVCPNHHAQLDLLGIEIDAKRIRVRDGHSVRPQFIQYHNRLVRRLRSSVT